MDEPDNTPTQPLPPLSTSPQEAALHLRAIRQLMENATVVQALTIRAAWVAAIGTFAVAGYCHFQPAGDTLFLSLWFGLLALVLAVNFYQQWSLARREDRPFPSPVLFRVARSMAPGLLTGGVLSLSLADTWSAYATFWILGNGLGLLAASHLLPRSLGWLGLSFFLSGLVLLVWPNLASRVPGHQLMAATFGIFHLVYAVACTLQSRTQPTTTL